MIKALDRQHRRYQDRQAMWQRYWDFYVGGEQLRRNASLYLVRRQKEPNDVYAERLSRVFYENYLGSCIDWYAAALFRAAPEIRIQSADPAVRDFYAEFIGDCDCRGTSLIELARRLFIETLVFGESYALVDFPRVDAEAANRAEEDMLGKSRAYLAPYTPLELINWSTDERGEFDWVLLKGRVERQRSLDTSAEAVEERWTVFERERFRVYARTLSENGAGEVQLIDEGRHGLARSGRVPLVRMAVSDGLWLANKAALLAAEHFNKSNALSWALHMGLFAMPVIYSEREWQQIVGEAYYIQLGPEDRFGWTEPEGRVFEIAAQNLDRLKDEIYRVCYLMTQAGGREARHLGQSGESKRRDFAVTREVLRAYGAMVKDFLSRALRLTAEARRDEVEIEVAGLNEFDEPDLTEELEAAERIRRLGIGSPRLDKEIQKRVALKYLDGASQQTKNAVLDEIEAESRGA